MNRILRPVFFLLFTLSIPIVFASSEGIKETQDARIMIMQETGEVVDDLPVMTLVPDTAELYTTVHRHIRNSFLDRFLDLYRLCQCYLVGEGALQAIEPAYLALTDHQGGFAKQGFILRDHDGAIEKPETPYVDITVQAATGDIAGLMSVTQLVPHEMAHVIYRLLSAEDSLANNFRSVDMHYFSLTTDYPTAFNEGFAEHMENVARHFEVNDSIRAGIADDLHRIERSSRGSIAGFTRDFRFPFRMGFYKAGMVNWYQKFEDYKRSEHSLSGKVRYKNQSLSLRDPEDGLTYRNAGVGLEDELRNIVQLHATEGAISAFFTALSLKVSRDSGAADTLIGKFCGIETPDHLQKQFLKYFYVIHRFVVSNNSSTSQFTDFISGYLESFPEERDEILGIYRELTGQEFSPDLPPSLWLMVMDHPHRLLVLDPFGAILTPLYTFNLNAAEVEDLRTVKGLTREEAEAVINYRNSAGFFESFHDLLKVPGFSEEKASMIGNLAFDQEVFERLMEDFEPELNIVSLLITPLLKVLVKALIYFGLILIFIMFLLRNRGEMKPWKVTGVSLRYLFLWIGVVLLELAILFLWPGSWIPALLPLVLIMSFSLGFFRRDRKQLAFTTYILLIMLLISLFSVV